MADDAKQDMSAKNPGSRLRPAIPVALVVFLAATAGFAWVEGLFGPAQVVPGSATEQPAVSSARGDARSLTPQYQAHVPTARQSPAGDTVRVAAATSGPGQSGQEEQEWIRAEKQRLAERGGELNRRQAELDSLARELDGMFDRIEETRSERIVMMAKLYSRMEPESVARQLSNLDVRTAVMILPHMNTRSAAKVMGLLEPEHAALITSKILAMDP